MAVMKSGVMANENISYGESNGSENQWPAWLCVWLMASWPLALAVASLSLG
jgi:hypothetical protein